MSKVPLESVYRNQDQSRLLGNLSGNSGTWHMVVSLRLSADRVMRDKVYKYTCWFTACQVTRELYAGAFLSIVESGSSSTTHT